MTAKKIDFDVESKDVPLGAPVIVSRLTAEIALEVFEDILQDVMFDDIAAAVVELRDVLGLIRTEDLTNE